MRVWWAVLVAACVQAAPSPGSPGRILDAVTGRGIPGVRINAQSRESRAWLHVITDSNGDYQFPEDTGGVLCELPGYRALSRAEIAGADGSLPESYDSGNGLVSTPIIHFMIKEEDLSKLSNRNALVSGSIVDEKGRPVEGAEVVVDENLPRLDAREYPLTAQSDRQGKFSVNVHAGEVELTVNDPRCRNESDQTWVARWPGRASLSHRMQLEPGDQKNIRLVLRKVSTYRVAEMIRNHLQPYGGVIGLTLERDDSDGWHMACPVFAPVFLRESGRSFSFRHVPAGRYVLSATLARDIGNCDTCSTQPVYSATQHIEVPNCDRRPTVIDIYPGAEVTGSIRWEGKPPGYFDLTSLCLVDSLGSQSCDYDAKDPHALHFDRVPPGQYHLVGGLEPGEFQGLDRDFYIKEARLNGVRLSSRTVIIGSDEKQAKLDLLLSARFAHLTARVVDGERHPLSVYTVVLMQPQGSHYAVREVDPRLPERYWFVPGDYLLLALTPALPWAGLRLFSGAALRSDLFEPYASSAVPISLIADETAHADLVAIEAHPLVRLVDSKKSQ